MKGGGIMVLWVVFSLLALLFGGMCLRAWRFRPRELPQVKAEVEAFMKGFPLYVG